MILCSRLSAIVDSDGTSLSVLVGTEAFATNGSGTPANTFVYPRLLNGGNFTRSIAAGRTVFGATEAGYGNAQFANVDGELDFLLSAGVSGQTYELFFLEGNYSEAAFQSFPGAWTQVFAATMESIASDGDTLTVRLKEKLVELDKPLCPKFAGTGGIEGDAELAGTPKPVVYGGCFNVEPTLIDKARLIYMVSARNAVSAHHAKDNGSVIARELTAGVLELNAAADYAALYALDVAIGHYATCTDVGCLKLGSVPVGQVTCDPVQYVYAAQSMNPADVILAIATDAEIPGFDTDAFSFIDVNTWADGNDSKVGYFAKDDSTTFRQAIGDIASSIGCWVGFDRLGRLKIARVVDPGGMSSVLTITGDDVISVKRVPSGDDGKGVPFGRITVRYPRNYTVQTGTLAGAIDPDGNDSRVRSEVAKEFPLSQSMATVQPGTANPLVDQDITTQFVGAPEYVVDGYGYGRRVASAGLLDASLPAPLTQFADTIGVPRAWYEVVVPFSYDTFYSADIGDCVTLQHPRFDLEAGAKFMVTSIRYELAARAQSMTLTLWG